MAAPGRSWDDVPEDVKETFERLGIPEAERMFLAGVVRQPEPPPSAGQNGAPSPDEDL